MDLVGRSRFQSKRAILSVALGGSVLPIIARVLYMVVCACGLNTFKC